MRKIIEHVLHASQAQTATATATTMSMMRWLRSADNPLPLPRAGEDSSVTAANKQVAALVQGKKRARGQYHHYDAYLCAKIAKYACENGDKSTVDKFVNSRQILGSTGLFTFGGGNAFAVRPKCVCTTTKTHLLRV